MKRKSIVSILFLFCVTFSFVFDCQSQITATKQIEKKKKILLRSSWQSINIGDIAHTPGVLALLDRYVPEAEVRLWAMETDSSVKKMLQKRFPTLQIIDNHDTVAINAAFKECDFLLHGSGPSLVASKDVETWINKTGKSFGVYGITLAEELMDERIIRILNF